MSQLKRGALLSYVKMILTNIVGILLTPFIIKSLGSSEYGVYLLVGSVVAYLGLMNLGIDNAIVRYVAKYKVKNDKVGEQKFLGTTMWIYIIISFFLTIIGIIIYFNLESIFANSLNADELEKAKIMFAILVGNIAIAFPGGTFMAICEGYENFVFPNTMSIIKYIIRAFTIVCLLLLGGKAISIVVLDTILSVSTILIAAIFVTKKLKIKISLKIYDFSLVKDIFSYSLWVFLFGIVYNFQWRSGQVILGITTDTATIAIYGVGIMLGGYYGAFSGGINSVLVPRATQMVFNKSDGKSLTDFMVKIGRLNAIILFMVLSGFILFGKIFVELWVGKAYEKAYIIALLLMIVMTLPLIQAFGNSILEARRKNRFKSLLSIFTVSIAILFSYYFSETNGVYGVIIPLVIAMFINSIVMTFYYKKIFGFKIIFFLKNTMAKPLIVNSFLTVITYLILKQTIIDSWFMFGIYTLIFGIIQVTLSYTILMNNYEKSLILNLLKSKRQSKK